MSTKSAQVDRLIREHLTLNEGMHAQSREGVSPSANAVSEPEAGQNASATDQPLGVASPNRVTEIRQELVQIMRPAPDRT